jgi:hypothetical protein
MTKLEDKFMEYLKYGKIKSAADKKQKAVKVEIKKLFKESKGISVVDKVKNAIDRTLKIDNKNYSLIISPTESKKADYVLLKKYLTDYQFKKSVKKTESETFNITELKEKKAKK